MSRRVLALGAILTTLVVAVGAILALLDVITTDQLRESLPRLVGILVVATVAVLVIVRLGSFVRKSE